MNIDLEYKIDPKKIKKIFGELDKNARLIEGELDVALSQVPGGISIRGEETMAVAAADVLAHLEDKLDIEDSIDEQSLRYFISLVKKGKGSQSQALLGDVVALTSTGESIRAKTLGQRTYLQAIDKNDIVFGIGPAGTGKTFLAMAKAVTAFRNKEVSRIILTRPAVEAGESLGFLPGDLSEKIDPYLRPLYDALFKILGYENYLRLIEKGVIEVAPLAYMRGRTLDSCYIVLDEAQNTTYEQMKMFLTRLGYGSKAIVTGDITQIDLPRGQKSGLKIIQNVLKDVEGIGFINLTRDDVVRHKLVQRIIDAYEKYEAK